MAKKAKGGKLERLLKGAEKQKEKHDKTIGYGIDAAVVSVAALVSGALEGYEGEPIEFGGMDLNLVLAVGLHLYAFTGSEHARLIHSVANGFLAIAAYKYGLELGRQFASDDDEEDDEDEEEETDSTETKKELVSGDYRPGYRPSRHHVPMPAAA